MSFDGFALEADGLSRHFDGVRATDDVSMLVRRGERHAIVGPNGAGKTTLFNLICGEIRPSSGRVRLHGEDVTSLSLPGRAKRGIGRTYQHARLFGSLTAWESVVLAVRRRSGAARRIVRSRREEQTVREVATSILERVGMEDRQDLAVDSLPHGAQRQLELAVALATEPSVLLLDEPTSGSAAAEAERMVQLIASLPRDLSIVLIEHDLDVVFAIADRITVLNEGRLICSDTPDVVSEDPEVRDLYLGSFAAAEDGVDVS